jgi:hypothetical protein
LLPYTGLTDDGAKARNPDSSRNRAKDVVADRARLRDAI